MCVLLLQVFLEIERVKYENIGYEFGKFIAKISAVQYEGSGSSCFWHN